MLTLGNMLLIDRMHRRGTLIAESCRVPDRASMNDPRGYSDHCVLKFIMDNSPLELVKLPANRTLIIAGDWLARRCDQPEFERTPPDVRTSYGGSRPTTWRA